MDGRMDGWTIACKDREGWIVTSGADAPESRDEIETSEAYIFEDEAL